MNYDKKLTKIIEWLEHNLPNDIKIISSSHKAQLTITIERNKVITSIIFETEFMNNEQEVVLSSLEKMNLTRKVLNNEGRTIRVLTSAAHLLEQ